MQWKTGTCMCLKNTLGQITTQHYRGANNLKCNIRTYVGKYTTAYSFIKASFIMSGDMYWFISKIIIVKKKIII